MYALRSISEDLLIKINAELESDVMIRAIHDVKGIDMGNSLVRYKVRERVCLNVANSYLKIIFFFLLYSYVGRNGL